MNKVTFTGYKRCLKKLETKNRSLGKSHTHLFKDSLHGYIQNVKQQLVGSPDFNHLYTMNLYKNTRAESTKEDTADGFKVTIYAGYFVPYGLHLETSVPRRVPIGELRAWQKAKNAQPGRSPMSLNLKQLQKNLAKNPNFYPILAELWEKHYQDYVDEVYHRVETRWENA